MTAPALIVESWSEAGDDERTDRHRYDGCRASIHDDGCLVVIGPDGPLAGYAAHVWRRWWTE